MKKFSLTINRFQLSNIMFIMFMLKNKPIESIPQRLILYNKIKFNFFQRKPLTRNDLYEHCYVSIAK